MRAREVVAFGILVMQAVVLAIAGLVIGDGTGRVGVVLFTAGAVSAVAAVAFPVACFRTPAIVEMPTIDVHVAMPPVKPPRRAPVFTAPNPPADTLPERGA